MAFKRIYLHIVIILLYSQHVLTAPSIVSSTYEIKETNKFGRTNTYAIFETTFDEDLYYMRQWPCPCNEDSFCPLSDSIPPPLDDSDHNFTIIEENSWIYGTYSGGPNPLYKFNFIDDGETACPSLYVDYETGIGTLSLLISYNEIPNLSENHWYRAYFGYNGFNICPGHPKFKYGSYYFKFENQDGESIINNFRFRVRREPLQDCPTSPLEPMSDADGVNWLLDGISNSSFFSSGETIDYQFYAKLNEAKCTNFSISTNSMETSSDLDIYLRTANPEDGVRISAVDGDDSMNFVYCNDQISDDHVIFYIQVNNIGNDVNARIIATTQQWHLLERKTEELMYSQFSFTNSFGNFPRIECGDEVFECRFPTYEGCSEDVYKCCSTFFVIPPTYNANPLIPWDQEDDYFLTSQMISYNASAELRPRTITWGLLLKTTYQLDTNIKVHNDPSTCKITKWGGGVVNKNYEVVSKEISFTPKKRVCNGYQEYSKEVKKVSDIISMMNDESDYYTLAKYQLELNELAFSENITGCVDYLLEVIEFQDKNVSLNWTSCVHQHGTNEWNSDPCCNYNLDMCCNSRSYSYYESAPFAAISSLIKDRCKSNQCSKNVVEDYISDHQAITDRISGCEKTFDDKAGISQREAFNDFVMECWNDYMTELCFCNDSQCTCNEENQFIECLADRIDEKISRLLFNDWKLSEKVTKERFIEEITQRYNKSQCIGPNAILYRDHFWYRPLLGSCVDDCKEEPRCFDKSCSIPEVCDGSITQRCYRYWGFVDKDDDACEEKRLCNWDSSKNQANCESGTPDICLNCNGKECIGIESLNEGQCNDGMCNDGTFDTTSCSDFCNMKCGGIDCDSETDCNNVGICSDQSVLDFSGGGTCIEMVKFNELGVIICDSLTPFGCINSTATKTTCLGEWFDESTTKDECLAREGCFDEKLRIFTLQNQSECSLCEEREWKSYFTWTNGTWEEAKVLDLIWTKKRYYSPTSLGYSFDVTLFMNSVNVKIGEILSSAFATQGRCRYGTSLSLVESNLCDCTDGNEDQICFQSTSESHIATAKACPYIESTSKAGISSITVFPDSFPPESFCQNMNIYRKPSSLFQLDPSRSVSSAVFQNTETNSFWVVENNKSVEIGQILSSGYTIDFGVNLSAPIRICIGISITEVSDLPTIYTLAYLDDKNKIIAFSDNGNYEEENNQVCGFVWSKGTYFSAIAVDNFPEEVQISKSMIIQSRIGSAIYFFVILCSIVQFIRVYIFLKGKSLYLAKLIFIVIVALNSLMRAIYLLLPLNSMEASGMESIKFFIFEFPSILFVSVFIAIVYLWINVMNKARFMGNQVKVRRAERKFRIFLTISTGIIYFIFAVFIALVALSSLMDKKLPCYVGNVSGSLVTYRITLAYWIFLCVLNFLVSVGFLISFLLLLKPLLALGKNQRVNKRRKTEIIIISVVAILCVICMLIRCILFLYSTVTRKSNSILAFAILEAIPSLGLLYYLSPIRKLSDISGVSKSTTQSEELKPTKRHTAK